ncbi:hypothetical protein CDAR_108161 [Caerostris darwini]|uniref:Uncharacterized protein n=1 Tax=Caerostris darwini TaxID=1538125 RepID=A0AAV4X2K3_9ARAC|nr:hypothetical protein CDAR_108161 [Caerostris darwini]
MGPDRSNKALLRLFPKWKIFQDERRITRESIIEKLSTTTVLSGGGGGKGRIESSSAQRAMLIRHLRSVSSLLTLVRSASLSFFSSFNATFQIAELRLLPLQLFLILPTLS